MIRRNKPAVNVCTALVEELREGLFVSRDDELLFMNRAFAAMHGIPGGKEAKKSLLDFVAPEARKEFRKKFSGRQAKVTELRHRYDRLHQNGDHLPTEVRATLTHLKGERIWVGLCLDLKDPEGSEELRQLREFSENILRSSHDPITVVDEKGSILYLNPASERLIKYKKEEVIGNPLSIFYEDKSLLVEKLKTVERRNQPISYEAIIVDRQGSKHYQTVTRSPLTDSRGKYIGSVRSARTSRKRWHWRRRAEDRRGWRISGN